jgi:predicted O-methyltransferase YrrM
MNLTNLERAKKLLGNLAAHPDLLAPYLRMSVFNRKLPIDLGVPWWSFKAIERADALMSGKRIFEYGTGGSTLRFAKVAAQVVSVEDNAQWLELVRQRLADARLSNVELQLHPFDFEHPQDFEDSAYISAVDGRAWDVVIIDGQDWTFKERLACFRRVEPSMAPGSLIVVDDFWRYEELLASNRARTVEIHESVGPCRIGVTSTAFFFY